MNYIVRCVFCQRIQCFSNPPLDDFYLWEQKKLKLLERYFEHLVIFLVSSWFRCSGGLKVRAMSLWSKGHWFKSPDKPRVENVSEPSLNNYRLKKKRDKGACFLIWEMVLTFYIIFWGFIDTTASTHDVLKTRQKINGFRLNWGNILRKYLIVWYIYYMWVGSFLQ